MTATWEKTQQALRQVLTELHDLVPTRDVFIVLAPSSPFTMLSTHIAKEKTKDDRYPRLMAQIYCQEVQRTGQTLMIADTRKHALFSAAQDSSVLAYLGSPIMSPDGTIFGTVCAVHDAPYVFSDQQYRTVVMVAHLLGVLLGVEQSALMDSLTGVYHRVFYDQYLHFDAIELGCTWGIVFIDGDNMKQINDEWGHRIGDLTICELARRISITVPEPRYIIRLGGDEFVVVLPHLDSKDIYQYLWSIAERIALVTSQPMIFDSATIHGSTSIGIAWAPVHGTNVSQVMHQADLAVLEAKAAGKARIVVAPIDPSKK
ncbi:GGDEF domain-containing protein [Sulfobacillus thermosulfidooxidans]|uniref:GGDEF domain-containing protein n=1 Tax=Sulfobacillus thermosulfidooxidans TaxID=28034 RepID=UPI00041D3A4F|nr:sensor domain-containing diguanylate cyclase [Sulfobacillus thermosulfidooxidans]